MGKTVLLSAPTNLGLHPSGLSCVNVCSKAPKALREARLDRFFIEMGGIEGGETSHGQYFDKISAGRIRNEDEILKYSKKI